MESTQNEVKTIQLTDRPLPTPPKAPEPETPLPTPQAPSQAPPPPKYKPRQKPETVVPTQEPKEEEPQETSPPPPPPSFGLELEGTAQAPTGSGVAVPSGGTPLADPNRPSPQKDAKKLVPPSRGFKDHYGPGEVAPLSVVTSWPHVRSRVVPPFPEEAAELEIEGSVELELTIDVHGQVVDVRLVKGLHPACDKAAIEAAKATRFSPALAGTSPVKVKIPFKFPFVLD